MEAVAFMALGNICTSLWTEGAKGLGMMKSRATPWYYLPWDKLAFVESDILYTYADIWVTCEEVLWVYGLDT